MWQRARFLLHSLTSGEIRSRCTKLKYQQYILDRSRIFPFIIIIIIIIIMLFFVSLVSSVQYNTVQNWMTLPEEGFSVTIGLIGMM